MKTKTLLLSLTTALAISAAAAPAAFALETEWVATGTVYSGFDFTGVFGAAENDLTGDAFTADFYIDTSKGAEGYAPGDYDSVQGGSAFGDSTPVSATLAITGIKYYFSGDYDGLAATGTPFDGIILVSDSDSGATGIGIGFVGSGYPSTIGQSFSVVNNPDDLYSFSISGPGNSQAGGTLSINSIASTGAITSAAPEPYTWSLMIAGVGMIGAALRISRRGGALVTA